jgi:hypothetical protein
VMDNMDQSELYERLRRIFQWRVIGAPSTHNAEIAPGSFDGVIFSEEISIGNAVVAFSERIARPADGNTVSVLPVDDKHIYILMARVATPNTKLSADMQACFREKAGSNRGVSIDPSTMLYELNDYLERCAVRGGIAWALVGILDCEGLSFTFAQAADWGYLYAYRSIEGKAFSCSPSPGPALGGFSSKMVRLSSPFRSYRLQLRLGDILLISNDWIHNDGTRVHEGNYFRLDAKLPLIIQSIMNATKLEGFWDRKYERLGVDLDFSMSSGSLKELHRYLAAVQRVIYLQKLHDAIEKHLYGKPYLSLMDINEYPVAQSELEYLRICSPILGAELSKVSALQESHRSQGFANRTAWIDNLAMMTLLIENG